MAVKFLSDGHFSGSSTDLTLDGHLFLPSYASFPGTPTISFDSNAGGIWYESDSDALHFRASGGNRAYISSSGITSLSNVYTAASGQFRNYSGEWRGTTGITGNGFKFTNTADNVDALTLSATGNATFAGSVTGTQFKLNNNVTNTNADSFFVYSDGGSTAYGMTLWNTSGTSGEWATMIFGPNQASRRISFGKANGNFGTNHAGIDELAYLDLDNGNFHIDGAFYGDGSNLTGISIDGGNATTLDSLDSTQFLRSDTADTAAGAITFSEDITLNAAKLLKSSANPTSNFLDFDDDSTTHNPDTNVTTLASVSGIAMATNLNDGGGGNFTISTGSTGTQLLRITTAGNATFAGNVTLNSRLTFDYGGDHYFEAGTNTLAYKSSGGTSIMLLNASTSAATFAGQVEVALASNQIKLSTGTTGDGYLNIGHFSNGTFIGTYGDDGGAADLLRFGVHSGDVALTINTDKSATFAGDVSMVNGNATGKFAVKSTGVHGSYDFYNDGTSYFNGDVTIDANITQTTGTTATFAADITAGSFIKSGGTSSQFLMADGSVSTGGSGISQSTADARYVNVTGDTMTGDLNINHNGAKIVLGSTNSGNAGNRIEGIGISGKTFIQFGHNEEDGGDEYLRLKLGFNGGSTNDYNFLSASIEEENDPNNGVKSGYISIGTSGLDAIYLTAIDTNVNGKIKVEGGSANWNTTTPGTTTGSLHFDPGVGTDHFGNAITFGASDSSNGNTAQAGIYLRTDGSYGSKMYFATTDSYASGSKVAMYINHNKDVYFLDDINVAGNIAVSGTVDGRDIATDGIKLDTIATNADVTPSWVPSSDPGYFKQGSYSVQYTGDMDSLTGLRILRSTSGSNRAFAAHHNVITIPNSSVSQYGAQLAFETGTVSDGGIKFRSSTNGTFTDWYRLYHEGHLPTLAELGAQASGSYITGTGSLSAQDLTDIGNLSGTNTGDQDLSGYALTNHNHDTRYIRLDTATTPTNKVTFGYGVSDLNSVGGGHGVTGFRSTFQASNRPGSGNYATGVEFTYHDTGARTQLVAASSGQNSTPELWVRGEAWGSTPSWGDWYQIYHENHKPTWSEIESKPSTFAPSSHNHDDRYYTETETLSKFTSTDGGQDDYTFEIEDEGNFSGNKWYHVATIGGGSGGLHIRGAMLNHVENFASQKFDLAIQVREANDGGQLEITGTVHVLHNNTSGTDKAGIRVIKSAENGNYDDFKVYIRTTRYQMLTLRLTQQGATTFNTNHSSPLTSEPAPVSGGHVEIDTSTLVEGNYVVDDSTPKEIGQKNDDIASLAFSGTTTKTLTLTKNDGNTITGTFTDNSGSGGITMTGGVNDRLLTATSASAIQGEANLQYNGAYLKMLNGVDMLGYNSAGGNFQLRSENLRKYSMNSYETGITALTTENRSDYVTGNSRAVTALVLGNTPFGTSTASSGKDIFNITRVNQAAYGPSTGNGSFAKVLNLRGNGDLYLGHTGSTGAVYATKYYDKAGTGYYLDPASSSTALRINGIINQDFEVSDLNTAWTTPGNNHSQGFIVGRYQGAAANRPHHNDNANWFANIYSHSSGGTASYGIQLAGSNASSGENSLSLRTVSNGSFAPWRKVYHEGHVPTAAEVGASASNHNHDGTYVKIGATHSLGSVTRFQSNNVIDTSSGSQSPLEIYQDNAGEDAFMTFHISGDYAAYFGLDGASNDFVFGGWSKGAVKQRIFHDGYHPNADKWTTARTITLAGDLSGSVSIDGSSNVTLTATVADDSHDLTWANIDGETANSVNSWGGLRHQTNDGYIDFGPANTSHAHIYTDRPNFYFNKELQVNGQQVFHTGYHPNADKWTTARTLTLNGDVTGSVSWDGSGNATLTTAVANNSHQHSQLYENSTISYGASYLQWMDQSGSGGTGLNGSSPGNPFSDWFHHLIMNHGNTSGYYVDIAASFHSDDIYFRRLVSGSLTSWREFIHSGNIGSQSVSNADMVDNLHASSFLRSDAFDTGVGLYLTGGSYNAGTDTATAALVIDEEDFIYSKDGGYLRRLLGKTGDQIQIGHAGTSLISSINFIPGNAGNSAVKINNNTVWNAGNDGSGSGLDADYVDGYHASRFFRRIAKASANVGPGWMTVAQNTSGRNAGEIIVTDADSGDHSYIRIEWMRSYADSHWTVLNTGGHSNRITGIRVLRDSDDVYGNKKLQVYVTTGSTYEVNIYEQGDIDDYGTHSVVTPVIQTSISGYSTEGNIYSNLDDYPFSVDQGIQGLKIRSDSDIILGSSSARLFWDNGYGSPGIESYYGSLNITTAGGSGVLYVGSGNGNTSGSVYATTVGGTSTSKVVYNSTYHSYYVNSSTEEMRLESDGDLHVERDVIAYSTTVSDSRLKDNVVTIDNALDKVCKLRGVEYTWNKGSRKDKKDLGVIAQEVEKVLPEIVKEKKMPLMDDSDTVYKTVDYEKLSAVLIEAVKELKAEVADLKQQINEK